ncbi:MAG: DNA polymerase III subunit gamma and tau, partial [Micromonosporaceae bacterium]|nr:DNA polymerase III subunit gamma and tau [Micromonosporaceae bacterium]
RSSQPAGDDGWPTPAMPGGGAASSGGTDWPDPAVPGGDQAAQGAAEGAAGGAEPARQAPRSPESSHQRPGRAGKGRPEHRSRRPGGQGEAARPAVGRPVWDGPAQEPPFDPDYDAAPDHDAAAYPGFDPGDEPVDDEQAAGPRESGADQAVRLLTEVFGAERIDSST